MSWKPEVQTDQSGKWYSNSLRFATQDEAEANAFNLMMNWTIVHNTRVVQCDDPVTHAWTASGLQAVVTENV